MLLGKFDEYPERPIEQYEEAFMDEATKKKLEKGKPKKKKKGPSLPIPDWAVELPDLIKRENDLRSFLNDKDNLKLD